MSLTVWDGTAEEPLTPTLWDGTDEQPVTAAAVPRGARRIVDLLRWPGFAIAHRCGSEDWAEYSMRGATESVLRGVAALEISVARTSDGVWMGLHDQTLLRTSGVNINPTTVTWSQITDYPNQAPAGGDPTYGSQPYERFVDLVAPWADSHVVFLDLKYQAGTPAARNELLAILEDTFEDPRQQVVMKFADARASWYADWIRSVGYTSWGHIWTGDYLANPAAMIEAASHWDWIGVAADATAQLWTDAHALDRPIIGAVVDDTADRDLVLSEGCIGFMCAAVRDILGAPQA